VAQQLQVELRPPHCWRLRITRN